MMTIGAIDGHSQFLCGYEIAPTENVLAIASTLRRAILNSRKIPKIVYIDNGKAFLAKYFCSEDLDMLESLFNRLGIRTIIAKKYHAQSKPIEPFWDWMGEVERLMPTYVGSSIEMQPPRLNRGEFLHRKLYDKAMQHTTIDIFTAHAAMAWWLDQYHNREKTDGHLKGLTPAEAFNRGQETEVRSQKSEGSILMPDRKTLISKAELNYLMMDLHITKLYRKGIRMFSRWYWNKELFGKQIDAGDEVHVKYDLFDRDSILVYDREGNLVCEAFDVAKVHPAARLLGTSEDQEELKRQLALKEKLKTSVVGPAREFLQEEIYPFVKKQLRDAKILQLETPDEDSPSSGSPHLEEGAGVKKKGGKRRSLIDRWAMPPDRKNSNIDLIPKTGEGSR
jgi:putative transposase